MRTPSPLRGLLISAALLLPPVGCTIEIYYQEQQQKPAECGNSIADLGEECDDGNAVSGDGCSSTCTIEFCGDSDLDLGEQCDDGNRVSGDGCSSTCTIEACGDGDVDIGEECDSGGGSATCDPDCTFVQCGDGLTNPVAGEECDDGNLTDGDGCERDCTLTP